MRIKNFLRFPLYNKIIRKQKGENKMEPIIIDVEFEVISEIEIKQKKLSTKEEWILAYQTLPNWYNFKLIRLH